MQIIDIEINISSELSVLGNVAHCEDANSHNLEGDVELVGISWKLLREVVFEFFLRPPVTGVVRGGAYEVSILVVEV